MFYKHRDLLTGVKIKKKKSHKKDILVYGLKSYFWVKILIQSVRKIKHHSLGYSGIWIHAMLCVKYADTWSEPWRVTLEFPKCWGFYQKACKNLSIKWSLFALPEKLCILFKVDILHSRDALNDTAQMPNL